MRADEQINVHETEAEADIDLELRAPEADPAEGANQATKIGNLTDTELHSAYRIAVRSRVMEEYFVRLVNRGEVKFSIWGPGEEIHGAATALALSKVVELGEFGMILHYRSACLATMWAELHGYKDFTLDLTRQQFSRYTDPMTGGRMMVNHFVSLDLGLLPVQSPTGMQLGKAAGYAKGFQLKGIDNGVSMAVIGDGTTATSDLHEAMNDGSVWRLPLRIVVTNK